MKRFFVCFEKKFVSDGWKGMKFPDQIPFPSRQRAKEIADQMKVNPDLVVRACSGPDYIVQNVQIREEGTR